MVPVLSWEAVASGHVPTWQERRELRLSAPVVDVESRAIASTQNADGLCPRWPGIDAATTGRPSPGGQPSMAASAVLPTPTLSAKRKRRDGASFEMGKRFLFLALLPSGASAVLRSFGGGVSLRAGEARCVGKPSGFLVEARALGGGPVVSPRASRERLSERGN
jgi:hypothetical protein